MYGTLLSNRLRDGDAMAFLELVQRTYAPAIAFARTRSADAAAAEALLLDAYVAVYVRRAESPAERAESWMLASVMSELASRTERRPMRAPSAATRWRVRARSFLTSTGMLAMTGPTDVGRSARCALRLLAPLLLFVLLAASCYDYSRDPILGVVAPPGQADGVIASGDTVRLALGRTATVVDGARLTFVRVESDSRCPASVQCVWAGDAVLRVRIERAGVPVDAVIHSNPQGGSDVVRLPGIVVKLVSVQPQPVAGRRIPDADYVARFLVSRAPADGGPIGQPGDSTALSLRTDAVALAIRQVRQSRGPAQAEVPESLIASLQRALAAVRASSSPARDTVVALYRIRAHPEPQELIVSVDSTRPWVRAWQRGETLTGNAEIDALLRQYGLVLRTYHPWSSGHAAVLRATRPLNVVALEPLFARISGVRYAESNDVFGGSHDISAEWDGSGGWRLTYSLGYGDCPAGCISRRFWTFHVSGAGVVTYLGSRGSPPPSVGGLP